jgi:hypothetical protein
MASGERGCGVRIGQLRVKALRLRAGFRVGVGELRVKWPAGDRTPAAVYHYKTNDSRSDFEFESETTLQKWRLAI